MTPAEEIIINDLEEVLKEVGKDKLSILSVISDSIKKRIKEIEDESERKSSEGIQKDRTENEGISSDKREGKEGTREN